MSSKRILIALPVLFQIAMLIVIVFIGKKDAITAATAIGITLIVNLFFYQVGKIYGRSEPYQEFHEQLEKPKA